MTLSLPKFVFINGPAGSGKSTLANLLCSKVLEGSGWREAFAEPIRDMMRIVFFPEDGPMWANTPDFRDGQVKQAPFPRLASLCDDGDDGYDGIVTRQLMIDFSEHFMKPRFGAQIFGKLLLKRCKDQELFYNHFVIDDSGFVPEAEYVISQVGADNCALIRLHRMGRDFSGDSRGYITLDGVKSADVNNDGAPMEMIDQLELVFGNI